MITKYRSLIHVHKITSLLNNILLFVLVFVLVSAVFFSVRPSRKEEFDFVVKKREEKEENIQKGYEHLGKGALSLCSEIQGFSFPDLNGAIRFTTWNTRPDTPIYDKKLELVLRGSGDKIVISSGQKLYLSYIQEHLYFSKETTPLWISPIMNERGEIWLEMGIEIISSEGEKLLSEKREIKIDVNLKPKNINEICDPALNKGIQLLNKGKWWAPDKLFECYGGKDFEKYKGCERLILEKEILFVKEGKTAIWKGDKWVTSDETQGYPLAKIMEISPYKMEIRLWDQSGLESTVLSLTRERLPPISLRMEDVFTRLRQRTSSKVSCRIDNRRAILKEGDWLIKTKSAWHTINELKEIEAILDFKISGDLFIFDRLEKIEGKEIFCGTLFDSTRTHVQYVRLPITQIKGSEYYPPTKKGLSTKIQTSSTEERSRNLSRQKLEPIEDYETVED